MDRVWHRGLRPVFFIVFLDAMGIGIVFPTLPTLLRSLLRQADVARPYGYLLAAYAVTMFLASPVLGSLSDRFGRRPVLLFSLLGTAFDDLVMAMAPTVRLLYLGRTLAGLTGANMTVANAYLSDVTVETERAKAFGRMNASFGMGFIAGPLLGGLVGGYSARAPFWLAAGLNLVGAAVCMWALPESRHAAGSAAEDGAADPAVAAGVLSPIPPMVWNPFASLRLIWKLKGLGRLLYVFSTMAMVGQVPSVLWVLYGTARFGWTPPVVGLSFAVFGLLHALCQALLPERAQRRLGREGTVIAGMTVDSTAYATFSLVGSSRAAFGTIPLLSLGGVAEPAVQAMLTSSVQEDRQGELQGVLTSLVSSVAILGPIVFASVYEFLRRVLPGYPGAVWLCTVGLYLPCVLALLAGRRRAKVERR